MVKSEDLRARDAILDLKVREPGVCRGQKTDVPAQAVRLRGSQAPFGSIHALNGLDDAHCTGKGDLSYLVNQFKY